MKQFNSYANATVYTEGGNRLPVGGYVLSIKKVKYQNGQNGNSDSITIAFDIAEGDQKDFFANQFAANTQEDKKWKGTVNIWVPKDDGTEKDGWTANRFRTIVNAIEESNPGYSWDWDEQKWVGKKIGGIFQEINTVIEGKPITYVGLTDKGIRPVEVIRSGKFKQLDPINKNGASSSNAPKPDVNSFINAGTDEDIPF